MYVLQWNKNQPLLHSYADFFWKLLQMQSECKIYDHSIHLYMSYLQLHTQLVLIIAQNSTIEYFRVLVI